MSYNKSISICQSYYNDLFMMHFNNKCLKNKNLYTYKKHKYAFLIYYPILYKKMVVFQMRGSPLKKKKMKHKMNINQSLLIESRVSRNKLFLQIPINCKWFNIK